MGGSKEVDAPDRAVARGTTAMTHSTLRLAEFLERHVPLPALVAGLKLRKESGRLNKCLAIAEEYLVEGRQGKIEFLVMPKGRKDSIGRLIEQRMKSAGYKSGSYDWVALDEATLAAIFVDGSADSVLEISAWLRHNRLHFAAMLAVFAWGRPDTRFRLNVKPPSEPPTGIGALSQTQKQRGMVGVEARYSAAPIAGQTWQLADELDEPLRQLDESGRTVPLAYFASVVIDDMFAALLDWGNAEGKTPNAAAADAGAVEGEPREGSEVAEVAPEGAATIHAEGEPPTAAAAVEPAAHTETDGGEIQDEQPPADVAATAAACENLESVEVLKNAVEKPSDDVPVSEPEQDEKHDLHQVNPPQAEQG